MGICYVIGAGECEKIDINRTKEDYVICADAGYSAALKNGIEPDLTVGDFDSFGSIPQGKNVIVHPPEKDDTDSMLAVKIGLEKGYKTFILYGMLGGRLDHTFANRQLLSFLCEHGAKGLLVGSHYHVTAVKNDSISFKKENEGMISVFSLSNQSLGIDIKGLKYQVTNFSLSSSNPMAVSNEFMKTDSLVSVENGTLAVMWEGKPFLNDAFRNQNS